MRKLGCIIFSIPKQWRRTNGNESTSINKRAAVAEVDLTFSAGAVVDGAIERISSIGGEGEWGK